MCVCARTRVDVTFSLVYIVYCRLIIHCLPVTAQSLLICFLFLSQGVYTFQDGLQYGEDDWIYSTAADRRFYTETLNGIQPAGEGQGAHHLITGASPGCYPTPV